MLAAHAGERDVTGMQGGDLFLARLAVMHVDGSIENSEHIFAIVHMPSIRLVRSVQAHTDAVHRRNVESTPCPV